MDGIVDPPLVWRYFLMPHRRKVEAIGLPIDDIVVRTVMGINAGVDGAFVASSGKNMGAFKGVGYPEEIAEFFRLEEYEGHTWLGHNRFPTNTPGWWGGAHPFSLLDWAVVHNGELSSYGINRRYLEQFGYRCALGTDTEVAAYLFDLLLRRHGLPLELACSVLASPLWSEIDRMADGRARAGRRRCARSTGPAMLNGPFAIVLGFNGGMVALNDRIKLRPLVAARQGVDPHGGLRGERAARGARRARAGLVAARRRARHRARARRGRRGRRAAPRALAGGGRLMAAHHGRSPSSACASTTSSASSAAAARSSAAGASTPSTSAPSPTTAPAAPATAASPTARRRRSPSSRTRSPTARTRPGRRPCARPPGGRRRPAACCSPAWATTARTSTSSTTSCSTRARSPTPPSTRCASRWSCAPTSAASRTASTSTAGPDGFKLKTDDGFAAGIRLDTPIVFAPMSYGSVSLNVHKSLALAARRLGILMNTGEGGLHADLYPYEDNVIVQVASGRFGVDSDYLNRGAAVEIKIGQGAKPGIGGHLPGEKADRDIAATRMIPQGSDAISPAPHHDIYSIEDLRQLIYSIKEATGYKPVGVKIAAVHNVAAIASGIVRAGADYVYIDGFRGGTGAAPQVIRDHVGIPLEIAVAVVDQRLRDEGIRQRASIIAAGVHPLVAPTWPRPSRSAPTPSPSARRRSSPSAATSARAATPAAAAGASRRTSPSSRGASTPSGARSASSTW